MKNKPQFYAMRNKGALSTASALLILVFHLWVGSAGVIRQIGFIGVDIFFFLSGYALGRPQVYRDFIKNRFTNIYLKFFIFSLIAAVISHWQPLYWLQVISGYNLLAKGGGAFLWFLPAIMLFYLIMPLYKHAAERRPAAALLIAAAIWLAGAFICNNIPQTAIFWLRIPIYLLGYHYARFCQSGRGLSLNGQIAAGVGLTSLGVVLANCFCLQRKLQFPFTDSFYLAAIPLILGVILLLDLLPKSKITDIIGRASLEIYAVQMIFGYKLTGWLLNTTDNLLAVNLIGMALIICLSVAVNQAWAVISRRAAAGKT